MRIFSVILFLLYIHSITAQEKVRSALNHFSQTYPLVNDLAEWRLKSELSSNGLQYYYIQQQRFGVDIENALLTLVTNPETEISSSLHSLVRNVEEKISSNSNTIQAREALSKAAEHLGLSSTESREIQKSLRSDNIKNRWKYTAGTLSKMSIPVSLLWIKHIDQYVLSYRIDIYHPFESHYWSIYINAENGSFIRKEDRILRCHFNSVTTDCNDVEHNHRKTVSDLGEFDQTTEIYNVYPLFTENPDQGSREVIQNPADPVASPYGWHDLDGNPGPDYFDTRGNNGFIQEDYNYNNSGGKRAEGGENLVFDFELDFLEGPRSYIDASLTNLFYWVNLNHDIFYHYGFDEKSGNFQANNYERGGDGNDQVYADAQDGSGQNNAQFLTLEDGISPRMEMFIWGNANALLDIKGDSNAAGEWTGPESGFQGGLNTLKRQGERAGPIVIVKDESGSTGQACSVNPILNQNELEGVIALMDRGNCTFTEKVLNAQNAGAIACIVCNDSPGTFTMGGTSNSVVIPAMMLSREDCGIIKRVLQQGINLFATMKNSGEADKLDSAMDNMIITHEYAHGISNRLTGGRTTTSCLNNTEQMGEGWSDYFGLMLTTNWETAQPEDSRPVGNWLLKQDEKERGIRPHPYSYNKGINPMTYNDIKRFSVPHGVGAVWCSMLWDMTWEIINQEGRVSKDIYFGNGGNNIALHIVMEALKIQNCNPGFVDGRDAILIADKLLYDGAHQLAIWKAFARRGLGSGADQKSSFSVTDGRSSSELPLAFVSKAENFVAKDSSDVIKLNWTSIREIDNKSYRILRSTDNRIFSVIHEIPGLALNNEPRNLNYIDRDVSAGQWYYYKLESQDESLRTRPQGRDSAIIINTDDISIFPNPSAGDFNIVINRNIQGPVSFLLYNFQGQKVLTLEFREPQILYNLYTLDLDWLPKGTYALNMITNDENFVRKLVIR